MLNVNGLPNNLRNENTRMNISSHTLKPGQLITGKVVDIYPNRKAAIQFAGKEIIAKLETALTAKQSYFFQVTAVGSILQLKKLREVSNQQAVSESLMQELGLPNNRSLLSVIQHLITQQIPFTVKEGFAIADLINKTGTDKATNEWITHMVRQKIPLTESAYRSLKIIYSSSVGAEMRQLFGLLKQTEQKNPSLILLQQKLAPFMMDRYPTSTEKPLAGFLKDNQQAIQHILSTRSDMLQQIIDNPDRATHQIRELARHADDLLQRQITNSDNEQHFIQTFVRRFKEVIHQETRQSNLQEMVSTSPIFRKIVSNITSSEKQIIQQWLGNNPPSVESSQQILAIFEKTANQQLPTNHQNMLLQLLLHLDATTSALTAKEQFLHLMKHFIQTSGLLDEARMAQSLNMLHHSPFGQQKDFSLKQHLLINQQSVEAAAEPIQRLIYALTGLQLNMTDNDQVVSQQHFQLPGDKFGLAEDIKIQFEGKQDRDNTEFDSDYCRILFQLQLAKIGETYITLSIQKRVINMTVYNDTQQIKPLLNQFTPLLREKLEALDYKLSAIEHKPVNDTKQQAPITGKRINSPSDYLKERIDYRI